MPKNVQDAIRFIQTCMEGALHFHDGEFDDIGMMKMFADQDLHPAVSIVLTGKRDRRTLSYKLTMMGAWLEESFAEKENWVLSLAEAKDPEVAAMFLAAVKEFCVHKGRLRIVSTAPSGPYLQLLLADEELGKMPWDCVFYTGTYNVNTGNPDLKTTLFEKLKRNDGSQLYNGTWFTAMGGPKMEPYLKDFSTLFTEEDWEVFGNTDPTLHRYQEEFMKVFNKQLVAPESLFQDGKEETPPEIVAAAAQVWKKGHFDAYVGFCSEPECLKWVKPKKVNILTTVARNAPNADWLLGLVIQPSLEHLWKLETGTLSIDPNLQVFKLLVSEDGVAPNSFELVLKKPEASMMSSPSAEIQNCMMDFFVSG